MSSTDRPYRAPARSSAALALLAGLAWLPACDRGAEPRPEPAFPTRQHSAKAAPPPAENVELVTPVDDAEPAVQAVEAVAAEPAAPGSQETVARPASAPPPPRAQPANAAAAQARSAQLPRNGPRDTVPGRPAPGANQRPAVAAPPPARPDPASDEPAARRVDYDDTNPRRRRSQEEAEPAPDEAPPRRGS
jgi:hypothetical protein